MQWGVRDVIAGEARRRVNDRRFLPMGGPGGAGRHLPHIVVRVSRLTDLSLRNRSLVALATVIIALVGIVSAVTLKQELVPDQQLPLVVVTTAVPGADAPVVESTVTTAVERAAMGLEGVTKVESTSSTGVSVVTATLLHGADLRAARADLQADLAALTSLPAGAEPVVAVGNRADAPMMQLSATGAGSTEELITALTGTVLPKITAIDGVRDVQLLGVAPRTLTITLDPAAAAAAGVSIDTVTTALAANGIAVPAGSVNDGANGLSVQVGGSFATVDDILSIPLIGAMPPDPNVAIPPLTLPPPAASTTAVPAATTPAQPSAQTTTTASLPPPVTTSATVNPGLPGSKTNNAPIRAQGGLPAPGSIAVTCTLPPVDPSLTPPPPPVTTCVTVIASPTTPPTPPTPPAPPAPAASTVRETVTRTSTTTAPARTVTVPSYVTVQAPAPIETPSGPPPTLGQVATVSIADTPLAGYTRTNTKPSVGLGIRARPGADRVAISEAVRAGLGEYQRATGGRFTVIYDEAPPIARSIRDLGIEGLLGAAFAVLVVLAFLLSMRMTLATALSIPLALLIALIGLRAGGQSLNVITLAGLVIALGRVVDDSAIVVENIKRRVDAGEHKFAAIPAAVREVAGAVTASTVATAVVFAPLAAISGRVGELFRPFAFTVVIATLASLLVALMIVPVFCFWLLDRAPRTARPVGPAGSGARATGITGLLRRKSRTVPSVPSVPTGSTPTTGTKVATGTPGAAGTPGATGADAAVPPQAPGESATRVLPAASASGAVTEVIPVVDVTPPGAGLPPNAGPTSVTPTGATPTSVTPPGATPTGATPTGAAQPPPNPAGPHDLPAAGPAVTAPPPWTTGPVAAPVVRAPAGPPPTAVATAAVATTLGAPPSAEPRPDRLRAGYQKLLTTALRLPVVTLAVSVLVLVVTFALAGLLKSDYLSEPGQNTLMITQQLPAGTSLEATDLAAQKVELVLKDRRDLAAFQVSVGAAAQNGAGATSTPDQAVYYVTVADDADPQAVAAALRANLARRPELGQFSIGGGTGTAAAVHVIISGTDEEKLALAGERVYNKVKRVPGAGEVTNDASNPLPSLRVSVNRPAAAAVGLSESAVAQVVKAALSGAPVGQVSVDGVAMGAVVRGPSVPMTADDLRALPVANTTLGSIATVEEVNAASSLMRVDGVRSATVTVVPTTSDIGGFTVDVVDAVRKANLPAGTTATIGGVSAEQRIGFAQLVPALLIAIGLVYLVIALGMRRLMQPLLLMVSVLFASTGAVLALLIAREPMGVAALVGALLVVGMVVTGPLLLIDLINQYRSRGMPLGQAVLTGAGNRVRPALVTAVTTIVALVPLAIPLADGGAFIARPIALVVLGGLLSSTLLSLFVVPVLYHLVEGSIERREQRRAGVPAPRVTKLRRRRRGETAPTKTAPTKTAPTMGDPTGAEPPAAKQPRTKLGRAPRAPRPPRTPRRSKGVPDLGGGPRPADAQPAAQPTTPPAASAGPPTAQLPPVPPEASPS